MTEAESTPGTPRDDDAATDRRISEADHLDALAFDDRGLIPVVAQSVEDGRVLMMAWANREALEATLSSGNAHFWSRSREELWMKGETSGNVLEVESLHADCDADTVLALVQPTGPACHTGDPTCFGQGAAPRVEGTLPALFETLRSRKETRPPGSWTVKLLEDENLRIKKIGEEAAELVHALTKGDRERSAEEAGDLIYHALAALLAEGVTLDEVLRVLESRR